VSPLSIEKGAPQAKCAFRSVASASSVVRSLLLEDGRDPKLVEDSWRLPFRTLVSDVHFHTLFSADVHFGMLFFALRLLALAMLFGALVLPLPWLPVCLSVFFRYVRCCVPCVCVSLLGLLRELSFEDTLSQALGRDRHAQNNSSSIPCSPGGKQQELGRKRRVPDGSDVVMP
jgi:hypothetical protein